MSKGDHHNKVFPIQLVKL